MVGTASDYAKFCNMLLAGGEFSLKMKNSALKMMNFALMMMNLKV